MRDVVLAALIPGVSWLSCGSGTETEPPATLAGDAPIVVHLGEVVDANGEGRVDLDVDVRASRELTIALDGESRIVEVAVSPGILAAELDGAAAEGWFRPRPVEAETAVLRLAGTGTVHVTVWARGAPVPPARIERSLAWTEPAIVDEASIVGLGRALGAAADDGHGGVMLDRWFRRFATTVHSERAAPAEMMDEIAAAQGADPSMWDIDALPFLVTAVHQRVDLAPRDGGCGQLRVSFASTHPTIAPLHLIFLFRQEPAEDDVGPGGEVHCLGTARRWGRLSALDGAVFADAARDRLDEVLAHERFLLAESVELTVSPWEWRQWVPVGPDELDNPPLFQTVDVARLNQPGPDREAFLAFVADNAAGLAERTVELPPQFRPLSARVPPSAPKEALDLGADADLAHAIEIIGCPTCHTDDAEFVQTNAQRVFSPFYEKELDARAHRLDLMNAGETVGVPPFGPLQ